MLEKIAVHQELWIKMLVNLGCDINLAKDLVQDMYLRVHRLVKDPERIMYKGDINRYFIWKTLRNLYYYDKRLFELYFIEGLSLRAISKGANIGLTSIHNSILNHKAILKEHLSEDLLDYFNQDFDKI